MLASPSLHALDILTINFLKFKLKIFKILFIFFRQLQGFSLNVYYLLIDLFGRITILLLIKEYNKRLHLIGCC